MWTFLQNKFGFRFLTFLLWRMGPPHLRVQDILRKYPGRFEGVIGIICENLDSIDSIEAKQSLIWIIGMVVVHGAVPCRYVFGVWVFLLWGSLFARPPVSCSTAMPMKDWISTVLRKWFFEYLFANGEVFYAKKFIFIGWLNQRTNKNVFICFFFKLIFWFSKAGWITLSTCIKDTPPENIQFVGKYIFCPFISFAAGICLCGLSFVFFPLSVRDAITNVFAFVVLSPWGFDTFCWGKILIYRWDDLGFPESNPLQKPEKKRTSRSEMHQKKFTAWIQTSI